MPALSLGLNAYKRELGKSAEVILYNMLLERDPANEVDGLVRLQRPGLALGFGGYNGVGNGPLRGIAYGAGTNDYYVLLGTEFYAGPRSLPALKGAIAGTGLVTMATNSDSVLIATGTDLYRYSDSDGLTVIAVPDDLNVLDVTYLNGYFLLATAGNRTYWIEPGEMTVHALNFFSAEYDPDGNVAIRAFGEQLYLFQRQSTEVWGSTEDDDAPFQRVPGRVMPFGLITRDGVVQLGDALVWPSSDKQIVAWSGGLKILSHNGIDELLKSATGIGDIKAWGYILDGHRNYVCTILNRTMVCDLSMNLDGQFVWSEYGTTGRDGWQAHMGLQTATHIVAGDDTTNAMYTLDAALTNDADEPLIREVSGGVTILGKPIANASVEIRMATGFADSLTNDDELLFRYSDDEGNTWTDWDSESVGTTGRYGGLLTIRRQGLVSAPGRIYHFRYSADSEFRLNYARVNEATGGKPGAAP